MGFTACSTPGIATSPRTGRLETEVSSRGYRDLRRESEEQAQQAEKGRAPADEARRRADEVDPDVDTTTPRSTVGLPHAAEPRSDHRSGARPRRGPPRIRHGAVRDPLRGTQRPPRASRNRG